MSRVHLNIPTLYPEGGGMSAKAACSLAWFITEAGGVGVEDLAIDPSKSGCNHTRHLCLQLGVADVEDHAHNDH